MRQLDWQHLVNFPTLVYIETHSGSRCSGHIKMAVP